MTTTDTTDREATMKALRVALKDATGRPWSVRGGTGTAWGWIYVSAPPARRVDGSTGEDDARELMRVLGGPELAGDYWRNFRTVHIDPRPHLGERAAYLERAQAAADLRHAALHLGGAKGEAARAALAGAAGYRGFGGRDAQGVDHRSRY